MAAERRENDAPAPQHRSGTGLAWLLGGVTAMAVAWLTAGLWAPPVSTQSGVLITISGTTTTLPFREYATRELGDPWDMNQRTDIGWFTWGADSPPHNLSSLGLASDARANTFFRGQASVLVTDKGIPYSDPWFFLLDTWLPGVGKLGKIGTNYPIDTTVYNTIYVRMKVANNVLGTSPVAQVFWSRDTIYYPERPTGGTMVAQNAANQQVGMYLTPHATQPFGRVEGGTWVIYKLPLTLAAMQALNPAIHQWKNAPGGPSVPWGDPGVTADSLRLSPFNVVGNLVGEFQVDWVRLVDNRAVSPTVIGWGTTDAYDIVVSTNADCSDFSVVAYSQTSGYNLHSQILPPGTYRVGLRRPFTMGGHAAASATTLTSCSTGTFTVQSYPSLSLTSPNPEGSTDDFATNVLGNAWNFDTLTDIDYARNVNYPDGTFGITTRAATDPAGNDLGSVSVYRNRSTAAAPGYVGDPYIYPLWPTPAPPAPAGTRARGELNRIDASRYRILTTDVGIERRRDLVQGSVARIIWHVDGDVKLDGNLTEIESSDIVLRHLDPATENGGKIVLDTLQIDMADRESLPLESDTPQSPNGWRNTCTDSNPGDGFRCNTTAPTYRPGISLFRLDFHEFSAATDSAVRRIKLAALERTGSSFSIQWTPSNPSALSATVTLKAVPVTNAAAGNYRPLDPTCGGASSVTIASGLSFSGGQYNWTPGGGFSNGAEYYVCAQIFLPGVAGAVDEVMSKWPVVISPSSAPAFVATPGTLRFTATKVGPSGNFIATTGPQAVTVSGSSIPRTAVANQPWLSVSNGSGTGAGQFIVSLANPGNVVGGATLLGGSITITPGVAGVPTTVVSVRLSIDQGGGSTVGPFGLVDTPLQGTTGVVGTIGVTGWVLDDVGVAGVKIYRNCLAFEPASNCISIAGRTAVFVGDATLVTGARPDVEALYPQYPQASRAAWGYLLLTNLLPHVPNSQMFGGQGALALQALATDVEGRRTWLGRGLGDTTPTNITMANDTIAKPFGAIDTPGQGQTVSGTVINFGWALTPDTDTIANGTIPTDPTAGNAGPVGSDIIVPIDGSTMVVYVDGVPLGNVAYDQCRGTVGGPVPSRSYCDDDVSSIFGNPTPQPLFTPRSANSTRHRNLDAGRGSIGAYSLNTATLSNGVHTIMWGVTDSAGRAEGLGSRFFTVLNTGSFDSPAPGTALAQDRSFDSPAPALAQDRSSADVTAGLKPRTTPEASRPSGVVQGFSPAGAEPALAQDKASVARGDAAVLGSLAVVADGIRGRTGLDLAAPFVTVPADEMGVRHVRIADLGRLELDLGGAVDGGYLVANGTLRDLPPGSHLDAASGLFTWAPGVGYLGTYRLTFVRDAEQIPVDVTIRPTRAREPGEAAIRMTLDLPVSGATVSGSLRVAGWALDPEAAIGSGIGAVHVWAQSVGLVGSDPVFLGAAALGGVRPDVAAVFGTQFGAAAFDLTVPALAPGQYEVTAYVWNVRTQRWEDARTVVVTVR